LIAPKDFKPFFSSKLLHNCWRTFREYDCDL
jgi:hypothetical protein